MFGFMKRILKPINDPEVFLSLYHTLIRSRLEYCASVWSPKCQTKKDKIERVQRKFIKYLCWKSNIDYSTNNYSNLCSIFQLPCLEHRRQFLDATFFFKCMFSYYDCSDILYGINFSVPSRSLRSKPVFKPNPSKVKVHSSAFYSELWNFWKSLHWNMISTFTIVLTLAFAIFYIKIYNWYGSLVYTMGSLCKIMFLCSTYI